MMTRLHTLCWLPSPTTLCSQLEPWLPMGPDRATAAVRLPLVLDAGNELYAACLPARVRAERAHAAYRVRVEIPMALLRRTDPGEESWGWGPMIDQAPLVLDTVLAELTEPDGRVQRVRFRDIAALLGSVQTPALYRALRTGRLDNTVVRADGLTVRQSIGLSDFPDDCPGLYVAVELRPPEPHSADSVRVLCVTELRQAIVDLLTATHPGSTTFEWHRAYVRTTGILAVTRD